MAKKSAKKASKVKAAATLAAPDAALMAIFGINNLSSIAVSAEEAIAVPAVNCAIRSISEATATLPRYVMVKDGAGPAKRDDAHPVNELLNGDANGWTSTTEIIRDLVAQAMTQNAGGILWINRVDEGRVAELIQYRNGVITVDTDAETGEPTFKTSTGTLDPANVIHLTTPFGRCPLQMARESIGIARVMEKLAASYFSNTSRPSGVIKFPKGLGDEGLKKMKTAWRAAFEGAANAGRTPVLWDNADFVPFTFSSVDSQFLELRKFQTMEIARSFRVPPSLLYELDRVTWANGEQQGKEFLTFSLEPWLQVLERVLSRALFTKDERRTHRIVLDRDDLTRASLTERAQAISSLRASKVLSANEGRDWINLPPYAGGDVYENTNITTTEPPAPPKKPDIRAVA